MLDTHVLLWVMSEQNPSLLSLAAENTIKKASRISISSISFWEIAMLRCKGRIDLDRPTSVWCSDLLGDERYTESKISARVGIKAAELEGFHGDPADRLIVAAAINRGVPLVTKDQQIARWAKSSEALATIW